MCCPPWMCWRFKSSFAVSILTISRQIIAGVEMQIQTEWPALGRWVYILLKKSQCSEQATHQSDMLAPCSHSHLVALLIFYDLTYRWSHTQSNRTWCRTKILLLEEEPQEELEVEVEEEEEEEEGEEEGFTFDQHLADRVCIFLINLRQMLTFSAWSIVVMLLTLQDRGGDIQHSPHCPIQCIYLMSEASHCLFIVNEAGLSEEHIQHILLPV